MTRSDKSYAVGSILSSLVIILIAAAVAATIVQGIYSEAIDNIQDQITMSSQEISRFVADKIQAAQVLADRAERLIQDGDDTNGFRAVAEQMKPFYDTGVFSACRRQAIKSSVSPYFLRTCARAFSAASALPAFPWPYPVVRPAFPYAAWTRRFAPVGFWL